MSARLTISEDQMLRIDVAWQQQMAVHQKQIFNTKFSSERLKRK